MRIVRLIVLILHLGILLLLSAVFLNAYIPPKVFPWVNLLSLGFPILITGYVICTLFWLACWKKRTFLFMLIGLFFIAPIKRWVNFSSHVKENSDIKIITFNIKGSTFGPDKIENYISGLNADIVLIQEDAEIDLHFKNLSKEKSNNVVSIFSKHRIMGEKILIKGNYEHFNAYANQTDIEIKGKPYRFINLYLESFKFEKDMVKLNGNSNQDEEKVKNIIKRLMFTFKKHQEQVEIIRKSIDESPYPVILAGDFNSVPNSWEYYNLGKGLKDAFVEVGRGSGTSFHDYKFPLRIDYIFTSESITPVSYAVDRSVRLSDHYPVIATFKLSE